MRCARGTRYICLSSVSLRLRGGIFALCRRNAVDPVVVTSKAETMQILFIGDIFGSAGRRIVHDHLRHVVETNRVDLVIANAENAAGGFGLTPAIANELFDLGCQVLTSGNHIWDKREIIDYFNSANGDESGRARRVLRPANY